MSNSENDDPIMRAARAALSAASRIAEEHGLDRTLATGRFPREAREQLLAEWSQIAAENEISLDRLREIILDKQV